MLILISMLDTADLNLLVDVGSPQFGRSENVKKPGDPIISMTVDLSFVGLLSGSASSVSVFAVFCFSSSNSMYSAACLYRA